MVAENQRDVSAHSRRLFRSNEYVDRRGRSIASRPLLSADQDVEAVDLLTIQFTVRRHQTYVLGFGMTAIFQAAGDRHIEFPRQIGEFFVAHEHLIEFPNHRRSV